MRCLSCDYNLSHLTEHRCPECGRAFDPSDPATFQCPTTTTMWQKWKKPLGVIAIANCLVTFLYIITNPPEVRAFMVFIGLLNFPLGLLLYAAFDWIAGWFKKTR